MGSTPKPYCYPVTSLQQGMLYNSLSHPNTGVEIEQLVVTSQEPFDRDALCLAWQALVDRHDILRTRFLWEADADPIQVVEERAEVPIDVIDCTNMMADAQEETLRDHVEADRLRDFEFSIAPLMRVTVFHMGPQRFSILWTSHHALLDGRSRPILLNELFDLFEGFRDNRGVKLDPPTPFSGFAEWLANKDLHDDVVFWTEQLAGFSEPVPLPYVNSTESLDQRSGRRTEETLLSPKLSDDLRTFGAAHGLSLTTLLHGAWALLLHHHSGKEDVVFGATWSCRYAPIAGADRMVGLLINTLPMRIKISEELTALEMLSSIRSNHLDMRRHVYAPLNRVVRLSDADQAITLFDSLVVFENYDLNSTLRAQGGVWERRNVDYLGQTSFPLTLAAYNDEQILLRLEYYHERFHEGQISFMLGHLENLLAGMIDSPDQRAVDIPYLSHAETVTLLREWNDTTTEYPRDRCIHSVFEDIAREHPQRTALLCDDSAVTYHDLDEKANRLARQLRALGVEPEVKVAFCLDRSMELVTTILAILKTGGAYVPLDPEYPKDRLAYMLEDTGAPVLITKDEYRRRLPETRAKVVSVDRFDYAEPPPETPLKGADVEATSLAYVMYTSGSTGRPKGIEITHRNVMRLVKNNTFANLDSSQVFLMYAPVSFDASTLEIWGPLLNGGRLAIAPPRQLTGPELGDVIRKNGVTTLWLTAGLFHSIVESNVKCLKPIRQLLAGGDVLSPVAVKTVLKELDETRVINGYGPTENTTFTCCHPMISSPEVSNNIPIGRPVANTRTYILDKRRRPVAVGVPGELYTSGDGVARGYLNLPELTAEVFHDCDIPGDPSETMYQTGDLVRYLPDGNIEFLGRIDDQVKLRGYRIELGEIEANMVSHQQVSQAVVIVREDKPGDKKLVGYYVPSNVHSDIEEDLRAYLRDKLPPYMVPQYFVGMKSFPINPNGKVDRGKLPPPRVFDSKTSERVAPRTDMERTLAEIWRSVLGVEKVGVHDDFFDLGGDSLLSVSLFAAIHKETGNNLPLSLLYKASTLGELASACEGKSTGAKEHILAAVEAAKEGPNLRCPPEDSEYREGWQCLVGIKPSGNRRPFFCVHAVGGNVLNYGDLAKHMDSEQPFYGVQSRGLDGVSEPSASIEEMASCYLQEVRAVQPLGPYRLGGGSMGGIIALEMAQQLRRQGQTVELLAMFDTLGPGYTGTTLSGEPLSLGGKLRRFVIKVRDVPLTGLASVVVESIGSRFRYHWNMMRCHRYHRCDVPIPHELRYWYVAQMCRSALVKYTPTQYDGSIVLIRGPVEATGIFADPDRGWSGVATEGVQVFEVIGTHESLVEQPELGRILRGILERLENHRAVEGETVSVHAAH